MSVQGLGCVEAAGGYWLRLVFGLFWQFCAFWGAILPISAVSAVVASLCAREGRLERRLRQFSAERAHA